MNPRLWITAIDVASIFALLVMVKGNILLVESGSMEFKVLY
jgi:hypothetical protein